MHTLRRRLSTAAIAALLPLLLLAAAPAIAQERVALVIGNGKYVNATPLPNPANDARAVATALRAVGFDVVEGIDLSRTAMEERVRAFLNKAGAAKVALMFYAGHGLQVDGRNYLVPVDARLESASDLNFGTVEDSIKILASLDDPARANIIILDACRDNPLARSFASRTRSAAVGTGLAAYTALGTGTLIAFSTAPGKVAADGQGANSPFTEALTRHLRTPGLEVRQMLTRVRNEVATATGEKQVPWDNSSLRGDVYLAGLPGGQVASPAAAAPVPAADETTWNFVKDTKDPDQLRRFIEQFPASARRSEASARLLTLEQAKVAVVAPPVAPATPPAAAPQPAVGITPAAPAARPLSVAEERALKSKASFKECDTCPEMVVVPAGSFMMGSPESEKDREAREGPQRRVTFAKAFAVGRFAVTFGEWDACVADGGCNGYKPKDEGWGRGKRPVINVDWNDAKAYVAWLSRKTRKAYRLLSEAEREYVTRAGTTTPFWWGSSILPSQANYDSEYTYGGSKGERRQKTVPVDSFQPNPWGLYQVHGNVWEWTEDCWNTSYSGAPNDGSARTSGDCNRHVTRGGHWLADPKFLRSAYAIVWLYTPPRLNFIGFRVARTLTP